MTYTITTKTTASTKEKTSSPSILVRRGIVTSLKIGTGLDIAPETAELGHRKRKVHSLEMSNACKKPRLWLPPEENTTHLLPAFWPTSVLLRRMWQHCHQHRTDLLSALTTGVTNLQEKIDAVLSDSEIVAAVMEHLVRSWGPAVLGQVYRDIGSLKREEGAKNMTMAPIEQTIMKNSAFIDLTTDDEDEEGPKVHLEKDCAGGAEALSVPTITIPTTTEPMELMPLVALATMETETLPTNTDSPTVSDMIQFALAYGFDMAHRYGSHESPPALWQEAAQTVRSMSPRDRQCMWEKLTLQSNEAAE